MAASSASEQATAGLPTFNKPAALAQLAQDLNAQLQSLLLSNYRVHIANHNNGADVKEYAVQAKTLLPSMSSSLESVLETAGEAEAALQKLHAEHSRMRRTVAHQSSLTELLEAPSLMDSCIRSGLYEEALDISDYANSLFFAHRLWELGLPPEVQALLQGGLGLSGARMDGKKKAGTGTGPAGPSGSQAVLWQLVSDVRRQAAGLQHHFLEQLKGKLSLPQCLRLLSFLRRLLMQQALAKIRTRACLQHATKLAAVSQAIAQAMAVEEDAAARGADASGSKLTALQKEQHELLSSQQQQQFLSLSQQEELSIIVRLRQLFLACRDSWHQGELDAVRQQTQSSPYQHVSGKKGGG